MFLSILFDQNVKFLWSDLNIYLIRNCNAMTNDHIGGCRSNPPMFKPEKNTELTLSRLILAVVFQVKNRGRRPEINRLRRGFPSRKPKGQTGGGGNDRNCGSFRSFRKKFIFSEKIYFFCGRKKPLE